MVGQRRDLGQVGFLVAGAIGRDLTAIFAAAELGFVKARRADAVEILGDGRTQGPHRKGLERREHARARRVADMAQQREVGANLGGVDDEGGGGDAGQVEAGKGSGNAGTGFHVDVKSCQTAMGPLKMKNDPAAIRPKPTRWLKVSLSPSQKKVGQAKI